MSAAKPVEGALLLCLDLQPVFLKAVGGGIRMQRRCEFAIAAAHGLGMPVAFTEQAPAKLGATEPALLELAGSPVAIAKDTFSALAAGSPARRALTEGRSIEHLILCGVETPICVFQTAVDALQAGIRRLTTLVATEHVDATAVADARIRRAITGLTAR